MEPYAGGAGAALNLLFGEHVERIMINDADRCIYTFWNAVLNQTSRFLKLLEDTPISVEQWKIQREIYRNQKKHSSIRVGFATFYLNRCNRSGILMNSGVIGGMDQSGKWKINARFNKDELAKRVERISMYKDRISIFGEDAIKFLKTHVATISCDERILVYLDPPYYVKGSQLYLNHYGHDDHDKLSNFIKKQKELKWIMTYDNVPEIHKLYQELGKVPFHLNYSAHSAREGNELLIHPSGVKLPAGNGSLRIAY